MYIYTNWLHNIVNTINKEEEKKQMFSQNLSFNARIRRIASMGSEAPTLF